MSIAIAGLALLLSGVGIWYAKKSADASAESAAASNASARVATAEDRRARTPHIDVSLHGRAPHDGDSAIYAVRNDGPQDLDSVIVYKPLPPSGIRYPVAVTGRTDWADAAEVGPLSLAETGRFTLSLGVDQQLPEFRVKIVCRAGEDEWELTRELEHP